MNAWTCEACQASNDVRMRVCDYCGADRPRRPEAVPAKTLPPAYQEPPAREYVRAQPTDRCTEPGCTKTVAEHIAEFKRYGREIAARLSSERSEATL